MPELPSASFDGLPTVSVSLNTEWYALLIGVMMEYDTTRTFPELTDLSLWNDFIDYISEGVDDEP